MLNLNASATAQEINAIAAMSNDARANLAARINATEPFTIFDNVEGKEGKEIICPFCGSGSHGNKNTGIKPSLVNGVWLYHCFAGNDCEGTLLNIIATANNLSTRGKDFFEVLAIAANITNQNFSLPADESLKKSTSEKKIMEPKIKQPEKFERLDEAQKNLPAFIKKQGGNWRGLSLDTLQRINCGFLPDVYFPEVKKKLPAVVIPNDLNGVYFRSIEGKFHKNNQPMATTTIFLPDTDNFDIVITEGQINAASILQAVHHPNFGIMACSGTSGEKLILDKLQILKDAGKKFRVLLAFDNDSNSAGQIASNKILNLLSKSGYTACSIDITKTPDTDLNDFLQREGSIVFRDFFFIIFERAISEFEKALFGESFSEYFAFKFPTYVNDNKKFSDRKTGFQNLDDETNSFLPGIYILGGLPALGKTSFALQLLDQLATNGEHCIYVSYEMVKGFLYSKVLAREVCRIETDNFNKQISGENIFRLTATQISLGKINNFHKPAYDEALNNFYKTEKHLFIWEETEINIDSLIERLENICAKIDKPPVVCIDYLQLLAAGNENTKSTLDKILHKIFTFRRETNTTFIIISSLNRANYQTEISFESFKESGSIEYSADVIWGLQLLLDKRTPADAEKAKKEIPRKIQLKCLKTRFGSNFDIGFFYYPNCDTFLPMLEYGPYIEYKNNNSSTADGEFADEK